MGSLISIDFGTTNTVVSEWIEAKGAPQTILLPGVGSRQPDGSAFIPSLLFIDNLEAKTFTIGNAINNLNLYGAEDAKTRLFQNMKRVILHPEEIITPYPKSEKAIGAKEAATYFLDTLCQRILAQGRKISELVLTVPVDCFETYPRWLGKAVLSLNLPEETVHRIIDEPTAAAFGYGIDHPGGIVLVIDIGGGTMDLSLVKLPEQREAIGKGMLITHNHFPLTDIESNERLISARVIAKAHHPMGGVDIDKHFREYILEKCGLSRNGNEILDDLPFISQKVEETKIKLSTMEKVDFHEYLARTLKKPLITSINRGEFEAKILSDGGTTPILLTLRAALKEIREEADKKGIGENKIDYVLLVGGTTLIPAVRQMVIDLFGKNRIVQKTPFEAVSRGALILATSHPVVDYLTHSYALELNEMIDGVPDGWEPIYYMLVKKGTEYPTPKFEKTPPLEPVTDNLRKIEFQIAEIEEGFAPGARVVYDVNGNRIDEKCKKWVESEQTIRLLRNTFSVPLSPPGMKVDVGRFKFSYWIDENRRLLLTLKDNKTGFELLTDEAATQFD